MSESLSYVDGRYRLIARVGQGGMGVVYRAVHALTGRGCALKLLRSTWIGNAEVTQRFFIEARAATRIAHANIVEVIDAGYSAAGPYLAMEWLDGETLATVIRREQRLSLEQTLAIVKQVLSALEAAHRAGIVHRDIKPANVFLTSRERRAHRVKVLDFGVAKMLESSGSLTESGHVLGTTEYLSPEQVQGSDGVDGRSDLFAVGILLFQLLSGTSPFRGPNGVTTSYRIVHTEAPRLAEAGGPDDPRLQAILDRALAKRPEERFSSANELSLALDGLLPELDHEAALRSLALQAQVEIEGDAPTGVRMQHPSGVPGPNSPTPVGVERAPSSPRVSRIGGATRSPDPGQEARRGRPSAKPDARSEERVLSGRVLRALYRTTLMRHGTDVVRAALQESSSGKRVALDERIDPHARYELSAFDRYCEGLASVLGETDLRYWHEHGQASVEAELVVELRAIFREHAPLALAEAALPLWASLFDFGTFRLETSEGNAHAVCVDDFERASPSLQAWVAGLVEQTFRAAGLAGATVKTTHAREGTPLTLILRF